MYINIPGGGSSSWKSPVGSFSDLPTVGNQDGDARVTTDTDEIYIWTGATWVFAGGSGTGDVTGPASSTDEALARFDGATGKIIQNSNATLTDAGNLSVTGTIGASNFSGSSSGTNTGDITVTDTASVDLSLTGQNLSATVLPAGVDHNTLANLTTADPHTQYAKLTGRAGGQTIQGGTAAGNNLILESTTNASKGSVQIATGTVLNLPDETASRVVVTDGSKNVDTATTTTTEVQLLSGRTNLGPIFIAENTTPVVCPDDGVLNTLKTLTIPANTLAVDGDSLEITFGYTQNWVINPLYYEIGVFGQTLSLSEIDVVEVGWMTITRISSTEAILAGQIFGNVGSGTAQLNALATGLDFTISNNVVSKGQVTNPDELTDQFIKIIKIPGTD